jgi:hypothetical protein
VYINQENSKMFLSLCTDTHSQKKVNNKTSKKRTKKE